MSNKPETSRRTGKSHTIMKRQSLLLLTAIALAGCTSCTGTDQLRSAGAIQTTNAAPGEIMHDRTPGGSTATWLDGFTPQGMEYVVVTNERGGTYAVNVTRDKLECDLAKVDASGRRELKKQTT
jgi:hypothetical protein